MSPDERLQEKKFFTKVCIWAAGITLLIFALLLVGCPQYKVYKQGKDGEASLRQAESEKLVQLEEAKANLESEKLNAQAEVERAKGAAEAIEIEQGKLTDRYIQYLWVRSNNFDESTTIYVPTETGLPILEAGKRP
jgi:hypothetical protein